MKTVGNKRDIMAVVVRNNSGGTIAAGTPVALEFSGTNDGLDVVLPSSSAAKADVGGFGVVLNAIADQQFGEAQVFGFCQSISLLRQTRAATTDAFSSNSDGISAVPGVLCIDTVNNAFSTTGGTLAKSGFLPFAVLVASIASWASSASATSDTRTAITVAAKAFLRMM
jgi:hypothetical protein